MAHKRLLCIAPGHVDTDALLRDAMPDWEICSVTSLAEAGRELRTNTTSSAAHARPRAAETADIDAFLRRHSYMQWVGVFSSRDLESTPCRELVVEHLCDYHTVPVDPLRLAHTLGHAHGWAMLNVAAAAGRAAQGDSPLIGAATRSRACAPRSSGSPRWRRRC
jgi:hypothetical protein